MSIATNYIIYKCKCENFIKIRLKIFFSFIIFNNNNEYLDVSSFNTFYIWIAQQVDEVVEESCLLEIKKKLLLM